MTDTANSTTKDTVLAQAKDFELSVLVFYRGDWCPFCQSYLKELNGEFADKINALGGRIVGIRSKRSPPA